MIDHAIRDGRIGCSDIANIMGCGFKTPYETWAEKTNKIQNKLDNDLTKWGTLLEPVIAAVYAENHKVILTEPKTITSVERQYFVGTPDRFIVDEQGVKQYILEIKTNVWDRDDEWGPAGSDQIPIKYALQCAGYMAITGLDRCDVAVLIAGHDYREYTLQRNKEIEDKILSWVDWFYTLIKEDKPPTLDGREGTTEAIKRYYRNHNSTIIEATPEIAELCGRLKEVSKAVKEITTEEERSKNIIKQFIGENKGVKGNFGVITWCNRDRRVIDWESIARDISPEISDDLIAKHSTVGESRYFTPKWKKEGASK